MQIANQGHKSIYHTFHTQIIGLRHVNFNQVQNEIYSHHKGEILGNKIVENIRTSVEHEGNCEKNDLKDQEGTNGVIVVEGAKVNWVGTMGVRFCEDSENFRNNSKRYSLNMSEDSYTINKMNSQIKKKELGSSLQEKMDFKKNMESEEILKIFPQVSLGSRQTCYISKPSKNIENGSAESIINSNKIKNFTDKNLMTGEGKFIKEFNDDALEVLRQVKNVEECEIFENNANRTLLSSFSESQNKNKFGSEKSVNSSCSTNGTMFESAEIEQETIGLFLENKQINEENRELRMEAECRTENNERSKEELYRIISELEIQICKERNMTKTKQNEIEELEKLVLENGIKYEENLKDLEKELGKKNDRLICEIREEHEKEIQGVIHEINEISSKQLTESVSRFQASIRTVQEEYKNFRISNESEKSGLLCRIREFEEIVKRMTDQIARLEGSSVINKINAQQIDKESQTSDSQRFEQRSPLGNGQFEEMEAKLVKQEKYISKQEKKLKEYKVEYERTFHRAEDYRRYVQENEMVIKNMEKDIKVLEKEVYEKNKNNERLGCIVNICCEDLMKNELMNLNEKYKRMEMCL